MKRDPERAKLEAVLRASKLVAGGFLGNDDRPLDEILADDAAALERAGRTRGEVAARMREIGARAREGIETWVPAGGAVEARMIEARGRIPCPWDHPGRYFKTIVEARRTDTGDAARWSDLSVHLIEAHGFFQGRGSPFRLEPRRLVRLLF
ncbi:MAG: hypothetical protein JW951_01585 [Lentisphaerae bacterium]|nr:hypothetical protein [Lentisphaerota bacterium]